MGIYIKGMEMPTSCHACDMLELSGVVGCKHAYDTKNSVWGRALNCPLVSVQPHGRLIDADELKTAFPCGESVRTECVRATIDYAPTIIPAEEGET